MIMLYLFFIITGYLILGSLVFIINFIFNLSRQNEKIELAETGRYVIEILLWPKYAWLAFILSPIRKLQKRYQEQAFENYYKQILIEVVARLTENKEFKYLEKVHGCLGRQRIKECFVQQVNLEQAVNNIYYEYRDSGPLTSNMRILEVRDSLRTLYNQRLKAKAPDEYWDKRIS